jgi:hypothetical protein
LDWTSGRKVAGHRRKRKRYNTRFAIIIRHVEYHAPATALHQALPHLAKRRHAMPLARPFKTVPGHQPCQTRPAEPVLHSPKTDQQGILSPRRHDTHGVLTGELPYGKRPLAIASTADT